MSREEEFNTFSCNRRKQWTFRINRTLLPIKLYYFFIMAALGVLLPFVTLYMKQLGLESTETGVIFCIVAFIGFLTRPVAGALADKFHCHKIMLIIGTIITGLMYTMLLIVPQRSPPQVTSITANLECNNQDSFLKDCNHFSKDKCHLGLSHLANASSSTFTNSTSPTECSFVCKDKETFQACYTNKTGSFNGQKCDGVLKPGFELTFEVIDIRAVLDAEVTKNTPDGCKIYDLKDIHYKEEAWQILCDREVNLKCEVDCGSEQKCEEASKSYDKSFFLFFLLFFIGNMGMFPIFPILDAAAYDILGDQRHKWGKQRLWGTFGFASFAVSSTFVMYYLREANEDINYTYCFYIFGILCLLSAFLGYFIRFTSEIKCSQVVKNVCQLLSCKEVIVFLFVIMFFGIVFGGLETFNFWFLSELGSSSLVFGFMLVVSCLSEVPMFWLAGVIIHKIGLMSCLYLALFCLCLRLLAYSFLVEPWYVLLIEPIHGVTYALMYAAAASYASILAPPGMSATLQGLLDGVLYGFGKGIGSLITGVLFEELGPRWTWRLFSALSIVILVVYFLLNKFVFKSSHAHTSANENGETGPYREESDADQHEVSPSQSDSVISGIQDHQGGVSNYIHKEQRTILKSE